jgi:DNA replication protein DnaC
VRTIAAIQADLEALARPKVNPFVAINRRAHDIWRSELDAWRIAHPSGDECYTALLAELDAVESATSSERARREAARSWGARNLPKRVAAVLEAGPDETVEAVTTAQKWLTSSKAWLVLIGASGLGKSVGAAWALRRCSEQGSTTAWAQAATLAVAAGGFSGEARAEYMRNVDVLVVDDLGTEHASDWARATLREILQSRHEDMLRTIITTNLSGAEFRDAVGERLARRIRDECVAVELRGEPMKTTNAALKEAS